MTPTIAGRLQTRIFLAIVIGGLWTAAITPALPRPLHMPDTFAYRVTFESLGIMTAVGLLWEVIYHILQQLRWDKDWPSLFALLVVINEAIPLWFITHAIHVIPGTTGVSSPILPLFVIHVGTSWLLMWLFMQGPLRVVNLRWRFEGGRVIAAGLGIGRRVRRADSASADIPGKIGHPAEEREAQRAGERFNLERRAYGSPWLATAAAQSDRQAVVDGVRCRHGHFEHPSARYCRVCGSALQPLPDGRTVGSRPPLGVLILSDGATHVVDHDVALGTTSCGRLDVRHPHSSRTEAPLAEIRVIGWQPVVSSPVDTISVALPGGSEIQAQPRVPVPLQPGTEFSVSGHRVLYQSSYHHQGTPRAASFPQSELTRRVRESAAPNPSSPGRRQRRISPDAARLGVLFALVLAVDFAVLSAITLAVHMLFVIFKANIHNDIVVFIRDLAGLLAWKLSSIFAYSNERLSALANYGIASLAYLFVARFLSGLASSWRARSDIQSPSDTADEDRSWARL